MELCHFKQIHKQFPIQLELKTPFKEKEVTDLWVVVYFPISLHLFRLRFVSVIEFHLSPSIMQFCPHILCQGLHPWNPPQPSGLILFFVPVCFYEQVLCSISKSASPWNKPSASEAQQGVGRVWKKEEARKSSVSSGFFCNFRFSNDMPLQPGSQ